MQIWAGVALLVAGTAFAWRKLDPAPIQAQNIRPSLVVQASPLPPEAPIPPRPIVETIAPTPMANGDPDSPASLAVGLGAPPAPSTQAAVIAEAGPVLGSKHAPVRRVVSRELAEQPLLSPPPVQPRPVTSSSRHRAGSLSAEDF